MKIGIIKEGKTPPDHRVPFSPEQCKKIINQFGVELVVQPSNIRCFKDEEYVSTGIKLQDDLSDCDVLFGVKEVPIVNLLEGKKYFFFSHTIKEQPYNKPLMKALIEKKISMVDYETLTHYKGGRILGFGRYAGIVGFYNALIAFGKRSNLFELKPANQCADRAELESELKKVKLPNIKLLITGGGRVAKGAIEMLELLGVEKVPATLFIDQKFTEPVYCQIDCNEYYEHKEGKEFSFDHFYQNPGEYKSTFKRFTNAADIFVSCHFWDNNAEPLFSTLDVKEDNFNIRVIADITCDINGSVPTTIRPTEIPNPVYGYNRETSSEDDAFAEENITVMAVDNLPCELPKDASKDFGESLIKEVLPALFGNDETNIIKRATICENGKLNDNYQYLTKYAFD